MRVKCLSMGIVICLTHVMPSQYCCCLLSLQRLGVLVIVQMEYVSDVRRSVFDSNEDQAANVSVTLNYAS